jgi:hypothetical protein
VPTRNGAIALSNRPLLIIGTLLIIVGVQFVLFGLLAEMVAFSYRRESDYSIIETSEDRTEAVDPEGKLPARVGRRDPV